MLAEQFWPFSFIEPGLNAGDPTGISIDFAAALLAEAGLEYELRFLPWPRVMKHAREEPNQLIITLVRTAQREDTFHWVGPIARIPHAFYGLEQNFPTTPSDLDEVSGLSVATVVDDVVDEYLRDQGFDNRVTTSSYLKGLEMMLRGRVDLFPGNRLLINYQCGQLEGGCDGIRLILPLGDLEQDLYFALSPGTDLELVSQLQESYQALIEQGRLQAIRESYLPAADS